LNNLCEEKTCEPYCGSDFGYGVLNTKVSENWYGISPTTLNRSHDLRTLKILKDMLDKKQIKNPVLHKMLEKLKYDHVYGTSENLTPGYSNGGINNVFDAAILLQTHFADPKNYNRCSGKKVGLLDIYVDGKKKLVFTRV